MYTCLWDMSTFVMIVLLSLPSDEILYFSAYKIFSRFNLVIRAVIQLYSVVFVCV